MGSQSWTRLSDFHFTLGLFEVFPNLYLNKFVAQTVKRLSTIWETRFNPWVEKIPWRRKWQPTPVFLPRESHGRKGLVSYSPRVANSRTRLSELTFTFTLMRTAGFICVCFNSVLCVVIFDGHLALSGHHVV